MIIIGSDNGLSPSRHHAKIWTNAGILLIGHLRINSSETFIEIETLLIWKINITENLCDGHFLKLAIFPF